MVEVEVGGIRDLDKAFEWKQIHVIVVLCHD